MGSMDTAYCMIKIIGIEHDNTKNIYLLIANDDSKQNITAAAKYNNSKNASSNYQAMVQF